MKVIIAPNAFKNSLSGLQAAEAMATGIHSVNPDVEVQLIPVADGGDGLVEVVLSALNGELLEAEVNDPLGRQIKATFCFLPSQKTAIIEMAEASGLRLLSNSERNPMLTSSFGTGQLIRSALDRGAEKILVGLGGSATNDGGIGMAAAFGAVFLDRNGNRLEPVGANLSKVFDIDLSGMDPRVQNTAFEAICDVKNPLTGENGAAYVYAPQKGATPEQVEELDRGLRNLGNIVNQKMNIDVNNMESAGAAGGSGMGLHVFFKAELRPGVDIVLDLVKLDEAIRNADLVLTGEGQIDWQTAFGKAPAGVAALAEKYGLPCFALAGSVGKNIESLYEAGFTAVFSICPGPVTLAEAMEEAETYLAKATEQTFRAYLSGLRPTF